MLSAKQTIIIKSIKSSQTLFVREAPLHILAQYGIPEEYTFWEKRDIRNPGVWFGPGCIYAEVMMKVTVTGVMGYGFYVCLAARDVKVNQGTIQKIENVPLDDWIIVKFEGEKQKDLDIPPFSIIDIFPLGKILNAETLEEIENINFVIGEQKLIANIPIYGCVKVQWHTTADLYIWKPDIREVDNIERKPKGSNNAVDITGEAVQPMQIEISYIWYPCFVIRKENFTKTLMPEVKITYTYPDLMAFLRLQLARRTKKVVIQCCDQITNTPISNATVFIDGQEVGKTDDAGMLDLGEIELYRLYSLDIQHPKYLSAEEDDLANNGLLLGRAEEG